ncbi:MAG TPA: trypsin-like peptidase domain-containing protein [Pirellulaceae bacterium]|nr:trypsin-like peptidase domain-containing protein [Pirellulaceae bacterium]HMO91494.1 trypsin-like peptidase domain-containing protein [Pirellulaceae bacterium]HMP70951.1 trypsin-like peptidase domain-containing protein [Pirellulaceae bacterium]
MAILKCCFLFVCLFTDLRVYYFTSQGCPPCKQMEPIVGRLAQEGYPIEVVDVQRQPSLANQFNIRATPTTVIVSEGNVVGQQSGIIPYAPLRQRLDQLIAEQKSLEPSSAPSKIGNSLQANGSETLSPQNHAGSGRAPSQVSLANNTTSQTKSPAQPHELAPEQLAMQATARIKVIDDTGISFATGTVIHRHANDVLILTCGHVFRESKGKGTIKVELGFGDNQLQSMDGLLIDFNANGYDVALVTCNTTLEITPVAIAESSFQMPAGTPVFSIGCNSGDHPTLRKSQFKQITTYDGVKKYDVVGRPVNGRSGGGLFTIDGKLIGVCNAAAVNVDEGIYTAINSVYWQLDRVKLTHLFQNNQQLAGQSTLPVGIPVTQYDEHVTSNSNASTQNVSMGGEPRLFPEHAPGARQISFETVVPHHPSEQEIIVIVRDKNVPQRTETLLISDPTPELLQMIASVQQRERNASNSAQDHIGSRRESVSPTHHEPRTQPVVTTSPQKVPQMPPRNTQHYPDTVRAQSPY